MKIDFYTNAVLTIIAQSTCALGPKKFAPVARAQSGPSKVVICNELGSRCVDVESRSNLD